MSNTIINTARSILVESASLGSEAIMSGAWAYPFLGISYVASHPQLYKSVVPIVTKAALASLGITAGMFFFTWVPQVAICAVFSGPFAPIPATIMVLFESYLLVSFVTKSFFLSAGQDRLFDAVLLQQGNEKLVANGREIRTTSSGMKIMGKPLSFTKRFSSDGIIRYLVSLPLNSIPVLGTGLFLVYNGSKTGPAFHARYFQLKKYGSQQAHEFIEKRKGAYTAFGMSALLLNLIPIAGFAFNLTSAVGAALWASRLEKLHVDVNDKTDYRLEKQASNSQPDIPVQLN